MNNLLRELAPISDAAWQEIDEEARRTLKLNLAGRKLVDFMGPLGSEAAAVNLGRLQAVQAPLPEGVEARRRRVQPLIELRVPFELSRDELESVERGGREPDLQPVVDAAHRIAMAEDGVIFHGYEALAMEGIGGAAAHAALSLSDDYMHYPLLVGEALSKLRNAGVAGPYGIALGPRCYTGLTETVTAGGYRIFDHVRRLLDGPVVWAPGVDGAVVLSLRGGDFELTVGEDFSIGYLGHTANTVRLYLQESMSFRVLAAEAAVPLTYVAAGGTE